MKKTAKAASPRAEPRPDPVEGMTTEQVLSEIPRVQKRLAMVRRRLLKLLPGRKEYRLNRAKLKELTQTLKKLAERRKGEILWPKE